MFNRVLRRQAWFVAAFFCCGGVSATASAQNRIRLPDPEEVKRVSLKGVVLTMTYYPSTQGKEAIPVVMLHGFLGSRAEYHEAALTLQKAGHAVLVPDLRGHGDSKEVRGSKEKLDAAKMKASEFSNMVADMEVCKKFLIEKNNAGELNIDKLCIVADEMGAIVAINWSRIDWSYRPLTTGKQGQDVKALVLLSPSRSFKGMNCNKALGHFSLRSMLSLYILVGSRGGDARTVARRMHGAIDRQRNDDSPRALVLSNLSTTLQGTKLLSLKDKKLPDRMVKFFAEEVGDRPLRWKERKNPLSGN